MRYSSKILNASHLSRMQDLLVAAFRFDPSTENRALHELTRYVRDGEIVFIGAFDGLDLVGFVGLSESRFDWDCVEMFWATVDPGSQRKGVMSSLVARALSSHPRSDFVLSTDVREYWERFGFVSSSIPRLMLRAVVPAP